MAVVLVGAVLLSLLLRSKLKLFEALLNPWFAALFLVVVPGATFVMEQRMSGFLLWTSTVLVAGLVIAGAMLLARRNNKDQLLGRRRLVVFAAVLLLVVVGGAANVAWRRYGAWAMTEAPSVRGSHDVVFIVMDTVRADHTSLYGYERDTTPNLKRLAESATVYRNLTAVGSYTLPTHASMFTGQYQRRHGAIRFAPGGDAVRPLGERSLTLAEVLKSRGYYTAGLVANSAFVTPSFGLAQGFDVFASPTLSPAPFSLAMAGRSILSWIGPVEMSLLYHRAKDINELALTVLNRADSTGSSLFLFLNYMDAHGFYVPPAPYNSAFVEDGGAIFDQRRWSDLAHKALSEGTPISQSQAESLISQYDGGIAYIDSRIGELMDRLQQAGRFEDALIVITSDHGEGFGEIGLLGHELSTRQDQVFVPLLIKYPGQRQGRVEETLVSHVDFLPTVLEVLGYPVPPELDGRPVGELEGMDRAVFSETRPSEDHNRLQHVEQSIRKGGMKLVLRGDGEFELYDLIADPAEQNDLQASRPEVVTALLSEHDRWLASMPRYEEGSQEMDPSVLERLRSLGYVQ